MMGRVLLYRLAPMLLQKYVERVGDTALSSYKAGSMSTSFISKSFGRQNS